MARLVPGSEFVGAVADALDALDFSKEAEDVREWMSSNGSPDAITDPEELSRACLRAAVKSNERGRLMGEKRSRGDDHDSETSGGEAVDEEAVDEEAVDEEEAERDTPNGKDRWD